MIIDYQHPAYQMKHRAMWRGQYNGAYYYSKEIRELLIPRIKTDRNWVTINIKGFAADHSIVFVHNNLHVDHYDWLKQYNDLILIVGVPDTAPKVKHLGKVIYLPLPIDVEEVLSYKREEHDRDTAYAGRSAKFRGCRIGGDCICDLPRDEMLEQMSHYKKIYAVGRTAIEARLLGAQILTYDPRYPQPSIWKAISYEGAYRLLQRAIDDIEAGSSYIDCTKYDSYESFLV